MGAGGGSVEVQVLPSALDRIFSFSSRGSCVDRSTPPWTPTTSLQQNCVYFSEL